MKKLGGALVILAVALSGCASSPFEEQQLGPVSSISELREAFIDAGGECDNWEQDNVVKGAGESGTCGDSVVLSTYTTQSARDEIVATAEEIAEVVGAHLVVGENWIINAPEPAKFAEKLGGTVLVREAPEEPSADLSAACDDILGTTSAPGSMLEAADVIDDFGTYGDVEFDKLTSSVASLTSSIATVPPELKSDLESMKTHIQSIAQILRGQEAPDVTEMQAVLRSVQATCDWES